MAALDWSQCPAVESIPGKVSEQWVFKNTRMPVSLMFENLEAGATIDEITEWFHLTREQIVAVLEFAARSLDPPRPSRSPWRQRRMLVLFDHSTPAPLRDALKAHTVVEAIERGWERLENGALLDAAEAAGFEMLVTADKNIRPSTEPGRPENCHRRPWQRPVARLAPLR